MRLGWSIVVVVLTSVGGAFGQSDWMIDPWPAPVAPAPTPATVPHAEAPLQQRNWARAELQGPEPQEAPATATPGNLDVANPWADEAGSPAVVRGAGSAPKSGMLARPATKPGTWLVPTADIVDPWVSQRSAGWAPVLDLIIDPWDNDALGQ